MTDDIISRIRCAVSARETTLQQLNVERNEVLRALYKARFVDAEDIHRIESRFAEKIGNISNEIELMEKHIREIKENE